MTARSATYNTSSIGPRPEPCGTEQMMYTTDEVPLAYSTVPTPHLLFLFSAHQSSPRGKSQIAHLDMHHLVFGINFLIHFVSLVSPVSIHLLIHLSTHPCQLSSSPLSASITSSLFHYGLKTYLFNKSYPPQLYFFTHWTAFVIWDWTGLIMLISLFSVFFSFTFLFIV